jgi:hypothetical protein
VDYDVTLDNELRNSFTLKLITDTGELQEGDLLFESTSTTNGTTEVSSKSIKNLGDTVLGDGPNEYSSGRLMILNNATALYENSDKWSLDQTGATYDINQLRCREALAMQRLTVWRYDGTLNETSAIYAHSRLTFCGVTPTPYMLQRATLKASEDTWNGVWVKID